MISIIIATYGDSWVKGHAHYLERAVRSANRQGDPTAQVITSHGPTLHEARNTGASEANGSRLVFLDADDWLDADFASRIVEPESVLQPMTRYWTDGEPTEATYIPPRTSLLDGNHLIVGCPVDRELFMDVGGFDDWPIYEDWALWLKMKKAGAIFGRTTGVYNVTVRKGSRNLASPGNTPGLIRERYS